MSSGSESDEEYVPGEPEKLSEVDSADEETEKQYAAEQEVKAKKRKLAAEAGNAKLRVRGTRAGVAEVPEPIEEKEEEVALDPEEEKKKDDDLWAKFLEGTDTKPKKNNIVNVTQAKTQGKIDDKPKEKTSDSVKKANEERERRIFEFAGETVVVEDNIIKETIPKKLDTDTATGSKPQDGPTKRKPGLMGLLTQINKKDTLSTLEKSALDWNTYKKKEGVEDEVQSHNKGKQG